MNLILQNLLDGAKNKTENNSSPPFLRISAERQDRPLPGELEERVDIPYGQNGLLADVVYPGTPFRKGEYGLAPQYTPYDSSDSHDVVPGKPHLSSLSSDANIDTLKAGTGDAAGKLPVLVFVHGGALVTGDRKSNRVFCQEFARRGFLVYSVEYRLIDRSDACGMISDVCDALEMVDKTLDSFGGDRDRVSLMGESAGGFLSIYAAAAAGCEEVRSVIGCGEHGLRISRLILISGMIYTTGLDMVGLVYKKALYNEKPKNRAAMGLMDPENPEVMAALPPVFLVSSGADFLKKHTLRFDGALERGRHDHRLLFYNEGKELTHAFPTLLPSLPQSAEVINEVAAFCHNHF